MCAMRRKRLRTTDLKEYLRNFNFGPTLIVYSTGVPQYMHIFYPEDGCKKKFHKIRIAGQGQKVRHIINQQRELFMAAQVTDSHISLGHAH